MGREYGFNGVIKTEPLTQIQRERSKETGSGKMVIGGNE